MKNKENKTSVPASVWESIVGNDGEESHNEAVHEDSETAAAKMQDDTPNQDVAAPQEHTHRLKKSLRRASERRRNEKKRKKNVSSNARCRKSGIRRSWQSSKSMKKPEGNIMNLAAGGTKSHSGLVMS